MQLLIVNFHYTRDAKPEWGIYPRTIKEIRDQITELGTHFEFISQQTLETLQRRPSKGIKACLLTFDDGLKEQMAAFDCLRSEQIPAMFFVNTGHYQTREAYDVHKLHFIYSKMRPEDVASYLDATHDMQSFPFPSSELKDEWRYDSNLIQKIKYFTNYGITPEQRKEMIDHFFCALCVDPKSFCDDFYMSITDLKRIAEAGMLGSHTQNHLPLASLSDEAALRELVISREFLHSVTGTMPRFVSYPYGGVTAVKERTSHLAQQAGYTLGVTMKRGINSDKDIINRPLMLMRVDTNDAPGGKLKSVDYLT
ncbi:MAG: hypothetical protein RL563_2449 [Pseudomonadota bacterium]|jgi:peptidoglycan/xylan/chitin deacetylase (PgdA/CDA1 family)